MTYKVIKKTVVQLQEPIVTGLKCYQKLHGEWKMPRICLT